MKGFQQICFELSSKCNARCTMCALRLSSRPRLIMGEKLFRKIIRDSAELNPKEIVPSVFGEPMLDPAFAKRIKFISKKLPDTEIIVYTNGSLFTEKIAETLLDAGVAQINFSLNAASPQVHEKIMGLKNFNEIVEKIIDFNAKAKDSMIVKVSFVRTAENQVDEKKFKDFWKSEGIRHNVTPMEHRAWEKQIAGDALKNKLIRLREKLKGKSTSKPCGRPFSSLQILADGRAVLCCIDVNAECVVGDANRQSLKEIWEGEALEKARELHLSGRRKEIPLCARCDYLGSDWS